MRICPKCGSEVPDHEQLHLDLGLDCSNCPIVNFVRRMLRAKSVTEQIFPMIKSK